MRKIEIIEQNSRVIVLIPGENVLLVHAHLPKISRSQWRQAIPYALEEQVSENVEDCFFAHGDMDEQGNIPVLVINKKYFESILENIRERNLQPDAIIPDFLALPFKQDAWVLQIKNGMVSVRAGEYTGFTVDTDTFPFLLDSWDLKPNKLLFMGDEILEIDHIMTEKHFEDSNPHVSINLLQGPYQTKRQAKKTSGRWRRCAYTFSAMMATLFLSQFIQYFYFEHEAHKLHQQISTLYRQMLPNESVVLEPRFHIEAILKRLGHIAGSNHFADLLGKTGAILKRYPSIKLTALHFDHQRLWLTFQAKTPAALNPLVTALSKQGLQVQQKQFQLTLRETS